MRERLCHAAWAALLLLLLLPVSPAMAHKLSVFATVEKNAIRGEAYFRDGARPRGATVQAFAPDGAKLADAVTDQEGRFAIDARYRCDHRIVVDAGGGHGGEYLVRADEFPADLPPRGPAGDSPSAAESPSPAPASSGKEPLLAVAASSESEPLAAQVESLSRQLTELRRQLADYEAKVRLHDVVGGIGYIAGLAGIAFYFLGVRRKERGRPPPP